MMTGFVQAAIVGTQGGQGAALRRRVMQISVVSVEVRTRVGPTQLLKIKNQLLKTVRRLELHDSSQGFPQKNEKASW